MGRIAIVVGMDGVTPAFVAKQVCAVKAWRSRSSPNSSRVLALGREAECERPRIRAQRDYRSSGEDTRFARRLSHKPVRN
jgi:hypothetical protein